MCHRNWVTACNYSIYIVLVINKLPPPRKCSKKIVVIFKKVLLNLQNRNHISGSLNEVLITR